jgi:hypothetical protein
MLKPDEEQSFFDRERDRLTGEIATVRASVSPSLFATTRQPASSNATYPHANPQAVFSSSGIRRTIIEQQFLEPQTRRRPRDDARIRHHRESMGKLSRVDEGTERCSVIRRTASWSARNRRARCCIIIKTTGRGQQVIYHKVYTVVEGDQNFNEYTV